MAADGALLVTGASGFLGREIVRQAAAAGQLVWGAWHSHPVTAPGVQTLRLDITDREAVLLALAAIQPAAVIHTAYSKQEPWLEAVTAAGAGHVAEAAAQVGGRLIHLSSDVVFDGEHAPYDESALPAPVHAYGRAKAAAEAAVQAAAAGAVIVRTSLISGLDPPDKVTAWIVDSLRQGRPITLFTDELRSPVWVSDLAAGLLELATEHPGFSGVINLAGPQGLSRYAMGLSLASHFGLDPAGVTPGLSREHPEPRPRDCRLDTRLAQGLLRTRLRSYEEGMRNSECGTRERVI